MATRTAQTINAEGASVGGPFALGDDGAYLRWRADKLRDYPPGIDALRVTVRDPLCLTAAERETLGAALAKANMAIVRLPEAGDVDANTMLRAFGRQLGLLRLDRNPQAGEDGITVLSARDTPQVGEFIPYTRRALSWHTDGYYNTAARQVRGVIMFCATAAARGGENTLLDHEIAYMLLRDHDPELVAALMRPDAMTVPAHVQDGRVLRPARRGPVFSVDASGYLHMRFTARQHSIVWRSDARTRAAVATLQDILSRQELPFRFSHRLAAGEGIVCNNVLHKRSAFEDDAASGGVRRLYRARYYERADA